MTFIEKNIKDFK